MQRYSFGGKFLEGGVWGGGLCVFFAVFSLSLPLSFPLPQKKGFFFFLLFLVCCFLSYYQIRVENQACPQRSLLQPKKKVNIGKFSFFCVFLSLFFFAELEINLFIFLVFYCSVSRCAPCHPPYSQGAGKYGRGEKLYI